MNKTSVSPSAQARLLAAYLQEAGLATLTHSQALEAVARVNNVKNYNVLQSQQSNCAATQVAAVPASPQESADRTKALVEELIAAGVSAGEVLSFYAAKRTPQESHYLKYAQDEMQRDGDLEFDDNSLVSLSDDGGAYILCWKWVDGPWRGEALEDDEAQQLGALEETLRSQGFLESDLDELVHKVLSPEEASFVNNQGMSMQLHALFDSLGDIPFLRNLLAAELEGLKLPEDSAP